MKKEIHPEYVDCTVICSCGETFQTRSTRSELKIELCSKCHPFFTGKQKLVDSGGRVERFQKKYGKMLEEQEAAREAGAEEGAEGEAEEASDEEASDETPPEEAAAEEPEAEAPSEAEAPADEAPGQDENEPDASDK